ncbi:hypothetical protein UPYG_G00126790 [Umbra pygmaea]|uniref:SH3 and PX domain-containing protein 2B n=1 Tax=Umbra pygmaea TaxID=75934 RepID=A0ABD0XA35_UMBPY
MPRRTVHEVTVQDVQKRRNPNKHYVYIIKVSWSDGSTEVIFRRYSKFFDLQMELLDKFPVEGGQKDPKRRIIPFLPGKILFRRSHIRDVAMKRLRPINEYCRALIQLPVYISQCEEVRVFFETRPEDLNPPKEEPIVKKKSGIVERATTFLKRGDSSSADPLLLDQYVAVSDYEKQESSEISLRVGQTVEVIEKNESGWWFVSSDEDHGWVPATCLEAQDDPDDFSLPGDEVARRYWSLPRHVGRRRTLGDLFNTGTGFGQEERYTVIYPYAARDQDEIDLESGMTVEVIQKNLEGWWKIRYLGQEGWAPASYLKKADILSQKLAAGVAGHASTSNLDGFPKQQIHTNENREDQKDKGFFPFKQGARQRPPPRRDLSIPRGQNLPKPPTPPQVEEEFYTIADFQTTIPDGISFQAGVKVEVIEKNSSGWWYIQIEDKEGWAPITFIDKYKKTSLTPRPNFLAPLPNEMAQNLEDCTASGAEQEDSWSKPLPDEPTTSGESAARPKLKDWKSNASKAASTFSGPLPPAPSAPPSEEKPALPPRRESINKSLDVEICVEKTRPDLSKPLPPKPPAPGLIMPLLTQKPSPFKPEKPPEPKREVANKPLHLKNEMGLECGHKVSAKEVKKFNLKPVAKLPSRPEPLEERPEAAGPALFMKPKPIVRPKPVPAAKPESPAENRVDITNLRSKLKPSKPAELGLAEASQQNGTTANNAPNTALPKMPPANLPPKMPPPNNVLPKMPRPNSPPGNAPSKMPPAPYALNNGKPSDEPKFSPKQQNGHGSPDVPKPATPPQKEPPGRPALLPRRPPPPRKTSEPSSPTESRAPLRELPDTKPAPPQLSRPPPPKPKAFVPPPPKDKEETRAKVPPKPLVKSEKPSPPRDKLPPLIKEQTKEDLFLAVADFEGDDQTAGFKEGTVFEVMERNSSGWWFCKNLGEGPMNEGWIPSNYLTKKP